MSQEAKYNSKTKKGTYNHYVHHGELLNGSNVNNGAPNAYGQNLAASKGTSGAKKLLMGRYQKSH